MTPEQIKSMCFEEKVDALINELERVQQCLEDVRRVISDPVAVHQNMLRGTIAWTPEHLRHLLGESAPKFDPGATSTAVSAPPVDDLTP